MNPFLQRIQDLRTGGMTFEQAYAQARREQKRWKRRDTIAFGHLTRAIRKRFAPERRMREAVWTFRANNVSARFLDGSDERLLQGLPKQAGTRSSAERRPRWIETRAARGLPR